MQIYVTVKIIDSPEHKLQIPPIAYFTRILLSSDKVSKNKSVTFKTRKYS